MKGAELNHPLFYSLISLSIKKIVSLFSFVFCLCLSSIALEDKVQLDFSKVRFIESSDTLFLSEGIPLEKIDKIVADSVIKSLSGKEQNKKKFISALFAFPFPLGFMGAHRVMLGTKPWVPVVYVATFGGCFGVLPLIDFFVITFSKDIEQYENNPNIFMWLK